LLRKPSGYGKKTGFFLAPKKGGEKKPLPSLFTGFRAGPEFFFENKDHFQTRQLLPSVLVIAAFSGSFALKGNKKSIRSGAGTAWERFCTCGSRKHLF